MRDSRLKMRRLFRTITVAVILLWVGVGFTLGLLCQPEIPGERVYALLGLVGFTIVAIVLSLIWWLDVRVALDTIIEEMLVREKKHLELSL